MAITLFGNSGLLSRLRNLIKLQRLKHSMAEGGGQAQLYQEMDYNSEARRGISHIDTSKWKKVDARIFGIHHGMISSPAMTVLRVLRDKGFEVYLVGGCVRDLILHKVPKDFDVITSAGLKQIRKLFHRAQTVGQRFPICMVHIKDSVIEVSSFQTVAKLKNSKEKDIVARPQMTRGCNERDLKLWSNSMCRDFTINSLFFDPLINIIYDYAGGMADIKALKLRTIIPAPLSFEEDCARMLRGIRIAARLGLSFASHTEKTMHKLSFSIKSLSRARLMMELNYMLSYGAAESSICLLQRFNILEILLPHHAAYLNQQALRNPHNSIMLLKLFFNLDKVVSSDRPSDCNMWLGLLAFHLALVNNPQDALYVRAFAAVLYHGTWEEGVKFARENPQVEVNFDPEITTSSHFKSDEDLAKGVRKIASLVQDFMFAFSETDSSELLTGHPFLVILSKKAAKNVAKIFGVLLVDVELYKSGRKSFAIDYHLLRKGDLSEARFVMGKVILETICGGIVKQEPEVLLENFGGRDGEVTNMALSDPMIHQMGEKHYGKRAPSPHALNEKVVKKQKKDNRHGQEIARKRETIVQNMKYGDRVAEGERKIPKYGGRAEEAERTKKKQDTLENERICVKSKSVGTHRILPTKTTTKKQLEIGETTTKKQLEVGESSISQVEGKIPKYGGRAEEAERTKKKHDTLDNERICVKSKSVGTHRILPTKTTTKKQLEVGESSISQVEGKIPKYGGRTEEAERTKKKQDTLENERICVKSKSVGTHRILPTKTTTKKQLEVGESSISKVKGKEQQAVLEKKKEANGELGKHKQTKPLSSLFK